jgi:Fe-S cluster assembly scaffold protein SufB
MYNWTVKRGMCEKGAHVTWTDVNVGANTVKYPGIILKGDNSTGDILSLAFAGSGQIQDTGARIVHVGKNTRSKILSKGIALDGGINSYRGLVKFEKNAEGATSHVQCDGLMMDNRSESHAYPYNDVSGENGSLNYEATVSKINADQLFYLQCRGLSEDDAKLLVVNGFCEGVVRNLNVEYSVEVSRLIRMILEDGNAIAQQ